MADLISRLQVVGERAVTSAFKAFKGAGEGAFTAVDKAAKASKGSLAAIDTQVKKVKVSFKDLSDQAGRTAKRVGEVRQQLATSAARIGSAGRTAAAGAGLAATALGGLAIQGANAADTARKQGQALGLSGRDYARWAFIVDRAGATTEDFAGAVNGLNANVFSAVQGNEELRTLFRRLDVQLLDSQGRLVGTQSVLGQLATAFKRIRDPQTRSIIANRLLGESGTRLLPVFLQTNAALNRQAALADRLGVTYGRTQTVIAGQFNDSLNTATKSVTGLASQLGLLVAERAIGLLNRFSSTVARNSEDVIRSFDRMLDRVETFIRDVAVVVQGGEASAANAWLNAVRGDVRAFAAAVDGAWNNILKPAWTALVAALGTVAIAVNAAFGTDLTAAQLAFAGAVLKTAGVFQVLTPLLLTAFGILSIGLQTVGLLTGLIKVLGVGFLKLAAFLGAGKVFGVIVAGAQAAVAAIIGVIGLPALLVAALVAAGIAVAVFWDDIIAGGHTVLNFFKRMAAGIVSFFRPVLNVLGRVATALGRNDDGGNGPPGVRRAGGGPIDGPGTGTSDSILARLSRGEYVIRAAAVRRFGQGLFHALNNGQMPARVPAFAGGGLVGAGQAVADSRSGPFASVSLHLADGGVVNASTDRAGFSALLDSNQFDLTPPNRWQVR